MVFGAMPRARRYSVESVGGSMRIAGPEHGDAERRGEPRHGRRVGVGVRARRQAHRGTDHRDVASVIADDERVSVVHQEHAGRDLGLAVLHVDELDEVVGLEPTAAGDGAKVLALALETRAARLGVAEDDEATAPLEEEEAVVRRELELRHR